MARFVIGALALLALWLVVEIAIAIKDKGRDDHHRG